jgi:Zn-dependent protease with chaperone function
MFELLGICLALAIFLAVNVAAAGLVSLIWRLTHRAAERWSARLRAQILFTLRLAPSLVGLIAVGLFFLPAYLDYEPRGTSEAVSTKLALCASLSILGLAVASWRAARALWITRRLRREWLHGAQEISLPGVRVRAFQIPHAFPIVAVVGILRPRLFVAEQVLLTLTPEELAATVAHEYGHLRARDNLKRGLLRACRDALLIPVGNSVERSWSAAAESAADEYAAGISADVALNLASALVKIARMVPVGARAQMPLAAFLVGEESRGIKARVRHLLDIASHGRKINKARIEIATGLPLATIMAAMVVSAILASHSQVLLTVHLFVERVVSLLS